MEGGNLEPSCLYAAGAAKYPLCLATRSYIGCRRTHSCAVGRVVRARCLIETASHCFRCHLIICPTDPPTAAWQENLRQWRRRSRPLGEKKMFDKEAEIFEPSWLQAAGVDNWSNSCSRTSQKLFLISLRLAHPVLRSSAGLGFLTMNSVLQVANTNCLLPVAISFADFWANIAQRPYYVDERIQWFNREVRMKTTAAMNSVSAMTVQVGVKVWGVGFSFFCSFI